MTATEVAAPRLAWRVAEVVEIIDETPRVRTLVRLSRLARELDGAESIVIALQGLLESKVKGGAGHGRRVAARALRLAHHLALWPVEIEVVGRAAMLHDLDGEWRTTLPMRRPTAPRR